MICEPAAKASKGHLLCNEACTTVQSWLGHTRDMSDSAIRVLIIQRFNQLRLSSGGYFGLGYIFYESEVLRDKKCSRPDLK